jgi:hypothetical protein
MHDAMIKILELLRKMKTFLTPKRTIEQVKSTKVRGTKYFLNMLQYWGVPSRPKTTGATEK